MDKTLNLHNNINDDEILYETNGPFPIIIKRAEITELGPIIKQHRHEQLMLYYVEKGESMVHYNSNHITATARDLIVVNSKDVHYIENMGSKLIYYSIKIDFSLLFNNPLDLYDTKLMNHLIQNHIRFKNDISESDEIFSELHKLIVEHNNHNIGYEIAIKASIYRMITLLLRNHIDTITNKDEEKKQFEAMYQLHNILVFIDNHYNEQLTLTQLSNISNISKHHFCRMFKKFTGKSLIEYINHLRINKAMSLLKETDLNISEIAMRVGFNDSNYFSRIFKKYKNISPIDVQR